MDQFYRETFAGNSREALAGGAGGVRYSVLSGSLPGGINIDSATGGLIGTPENISAVHADGDLAVWKAVVMANAPLSCRSLIGSLRGRDRTLWTHLS